MKDSDLDFIIKSVMEEETDSINLSENIKDEIMKKTKKRSVFNMIHRFLNRKVAVPIPIFSCVLGIMIFITFLPVIKNTKSGINYNDIKTINTGNSEIIIRNIKDVSINEKAKD